jgi:hypothetical protein
MASNTPTDAPSRPPSLATAERSRARPDGETRARRFTARRDSDSLIERIVLEHARSLRPSRRPPGQARLAQRAALAASAPVPR